DPKDHLYIRIDRRRKLPGTIILRALGYSTEEILALFFDNDVIYLGKDKFEMDIVPERMRGQQLHFDLMGPRGKVLVESGKRVTARHIKELQKAGIERIEIPVDFIAGRTLARDVVDPETGELLYSANDILTEDMVTAMAEAGFDRIETIYTNDIDCGPFISETLRLDSTRSALDAQVEIYRMMRPGEPPTKEAAQALFTNLFFNIDRYY